MKPLAYQYSREANFLWEMRKYVLLQATLAVTITYSAALSPPGGLWPDNDNINNGGHLTSDPVLKSTYPGRYKVFFYCNATAFVASLFTVILLLVHSLSRRRWWLRALQAAMILSQFGLMGAYAAGSCREVAMSAYILALVAMVSSYVCAQVLCFAFWALRTRHGGSKSLTPEAPEAVDGARKKLLIFATLVATVTYQAGFLSSGSPDQHHLAGDPVLRGNRFMGFFYLNTTAFVASLVIIMLLMSRTATRHGFRSSALWVCTGAALVGLTGAIAIESSRSVKTSAYVVAFVAAVLRDIGQQILVLLCKPVGNWLGNVQGTERRFLKLDQFPSQDDANEQAQVLPEQQGNAVHAAMILDLLGLIGAYVAGNSRQVSKSVYTSVIVVAVFLYVGIHVLVFMLEVFPNHATWRGMVKPKLEESMPERLKKLFDLQTEEEDKEVKWKLEKSCKLLLLLATLSAVITYQAGMSPTGGFWQQNKTGHVVGNPVLQTGHDAFIASIFIVSSLRWWLWTLGMFCIIGAFSAARSYCTLSISGLFAQDGGLKFHKLFGTVELEDNLDPGLSDPRETVDANQLRHMSRKYLLLLAILAASITYQTGLKPPGSLWQANGTDGHHSGAGEPVLDTTYLRRYLVVHYCNATAFMACLVILILLLSNISRPRGIKNCALQVAIILDLLGLIGVFAAGSCSKSKLAVDREDQNRPVKRNNPRQATWRVASGAPHHMTGNQSLLLACAHNGRDDGEDIVVHPATKGEVPLRVQGSGSVRTESIALDDVWYVPGLDSNLVSTGQLVRQGCAISLGPGGCRITKGGALVGTARFTEACQFVLDYLKAN